MDSITSIVNARVFTPKGFIPDGFVRITGGKIADVGQGLFPGREGGQLDARGMLLVPGLIEKHVHGGNGADFIEGTRSAFDRILQFYAGCGVTSIAGTTTAAPVDALIRVLETAVEWKSDTTRPRPHLVGIHLEGPYLNREQSGAQPTDNIMGPSPEQIDRLLDFAGVISEITIAPEVPGALEVIRAFADRGILVSAGHSQAMEPEVRAAVDAGLSHVTHIYSTMSSVVRRGPWRVPGLLECALVYNELTTEMIADLRHLPPTLMRLVLKCKMPHRLCLVSDAMQGAGRPEGERFSLGGQEVMVEDNVAMMPDRRAFAGSITPIDQMLRNVVFSLGLELEDALPLVTLNPARILGIDDRTGSIQAGKDADLVILDDKLMVQTTIVGGEIVFRSNTH